MATVVVRGFVKNIRYLESGSVCFDLAEKVKNKNCYSYYDCIGSISESKKDHLTDNKIVEIVGELFVLKNEKDGKNYTNVKINIYNLIFYDRENSKREDN